MVFEEFLKAKGVASVWEFVDHLDGSDCEDCLGAGLEDDCGELADILLKGIFVEES
jgi:hypothetical protein